MVDKSRKMYKNGVKIVIDINEMLWLNWKHTKKGLDHKNVSIITKNTPQTMKI